jgi:16S rRNA (guanine1516-N2)-methyltransferase
MPTIAIAAITDNLLSIAMAQNLAIKLQLPIVPIDSTAYGFLLICTATHLELKDTTAKYRPIYVDFLHGKSAYRYIHGGGYGQLIAKAVGVKKNSRLKVLDATAGLGQDAFVLAGLGCYVKLIEKSPIIAALLTDGLNRAKDVFTANNINMILVQADAIKYMQQLNSDDQPDVVYLDPMYPHSTKSALAKKELCIIRQIVGDDLNADQLLITALKIALKRVVVKRPRLAANIANIKPDIVFSGKSCRFDVYLCLQRKNFVSK